MNTAAFLRWIKCVRKKYFFILKQNFIFTYLIIVFINIFNIQIKIKTILFFKNSHKKKKCKY